MRTFKGPLATAVLIWALVAASIHIYAVVRVVNTAFLCGVHLLCLLPLGFILYPATPKSPKDRPTAMDVILAALAFACALYLTKNYSYAETRWYLASPVSTLEAVLGAINVLLIVEATRRAVSPVMAVVEIAAIVHLALGQFMPGVLHHPGFSFVRVTEMFYLNRDQGIYGMLTSISSTYIVLFVLFGAFIAQSGVGEFFTDLAFKIAGKSPGGPAKVAVISSALFGTVSGIGTANVYGTGTFTIPLMKKMGYKPEFAGAVEAAASTGGQYMPPVMGAAAFVMAQWIGIPYVKLAMHASLSAILFFVSIGICVDIRARRRNLAAGGDLGVGTKPWSEILKRVYNLLPLAVILGLLLAGYSPMYAGLAAIIVTVAISYFSRDTRMTLGKIIAALDTGMKNTIMVAIACAGAGIIVASISHTALGLSFVSMVLSLSRGHVLPALLLTALISLILGTGMPTTPAYILTASLAAPALTQMGVDVVAAHLFVLYFAVISEVTPPVAICAYAGANIAKADPIKTGVEAMKLSIGGYIVPIAFAFNGAFLLNGNVGGILLASALGVWGLWLVNVGLEGWMFRLISPPMRIVSVALGCACFVPNQLVAIAAALIALGVALAERRRAQGGVSARASA